MIRRVATAFAVLFVAVLLAASSAWWLVLRGGTPTVSVGAWRMSALAGSADADLYTRARVAIAGLFALNASETIYFEAARDDAGHALRANCGYMLTGRKLDARWWSITAYADDLFLIPNAEKRFSYNMGNLAYGPDGGFVLTAGPVARPGNWLPTGTRGGFRLLLRLYNPAPALLAHVQTAPVPSIAQVGDCP